MGQNKPFFTGETGKGGKATNERGSFLGDFAAKKKNSRAKKKGNLEKKKNNNNWRENNAGKGIGDVVKEPVSTDGGRSEGEENGD